MYKVYLENYGTVYEPAEGGYDVEVSDVNLWCEFEDANIAEEAVSLEVEGERDIVVYHRSGALYDYATGDCDSDGDMITEEEYAEFIYEIDRGRSHYIGEGYRFICVEDGMPEPYPKVYVGYR